MTDWREAFAAAFADGEPIEQVVYARVLGDQRPAELDTYSCLTRDELHRMEAWLGLGVGDLLADLGCGRAGPGIWLAERASARLVGVDVTDAPFPAAATRAARAGVPATFHVASMASTGLPDASVDAVVSVDALQFVEYPVRAFCEVARILRPGGRLALTAAEPVDDLGAAAARRPVTAAHAEAAGLVVEHCAPPPDWPKTAQRIAAAMVGASHEIAAATHADPDEVRAALQRLAAHPRQEQRILLLAHHPVEPGPVGP